ncbi:hypothetical protein [Acetobacter nitrogenifigens]|nr:hypothetical protein [Acetobacter nitrogenifigens]
MERGRSFLDHYEISPSPAQQPKWRAAVIVEPQFTVRNAQSSIRATA